MSAIKTALKRGIVRAVARIPTELIDLLRQGHYKTVSFDVFDTLLKRNVPTPQDVFQLLEKRYQQHFGNRVEIASARACAEVRATKRVAYKEVNLREIYGEMDGLSEEERRWLAEEEMHIEQLICQRCHPMGRVYDWCIQQGIPVILISDMYLPHEVIVQMLACAGYTGWKRLYLSSAVRCNKVDGTLFDYALSEEELQPDQLIHIGDSLRGDYLTPRRKGIQTILIREQIEQRYFNKREASTERERRIMPYRILDTLVKNNTCLYDHYFQKLGYAAIGPILYGYSKWLAHQLREERIERVFFLAREGYFLKRGFDLLEIQGVQSEVIQVSRKATALPRMRLAKNFEELLDIIVTDPAEFTLKKLLISCGLDDERGERLLKGQNLNLHSQVSALTTEQQEQLFRTLKPEIDALSKEQDKNLRGYLAQKGFAGPMAICDVGWHRTIQYALQQIMPDESMIGFYIGEDIKDVRIEAPAFSFLFDSGKNHEIYRCVMAATNLFEIFFSSTEGSTVGYERNAEGHYICRQLPPEHTGMSAESVKELQDAACDFVRDFRKLDTELDFDVNPSACSAGYRTFIYKMDNKAIRELKRFSFLHIIKAPMTARHHLGWYILHPHKFVDEFLYNGCKVPFLKSVFKIPLPYVQMVDMMRSVDRHIKNRAD